jgi:hypothetical protein
MTLAAVDLTPNRSIRDSRWTKLQLGVASTVRIQNLR